MTCLQGKEDFKDGKLGPSKMKWFQPGWESLWHEPMQNAALLRRGMALNYKNWLPFACSALNVSLLKSRVRSRHPVLWFLAWFWKQKMPDCFAVEVYVDVNGRSRSRGAQQESQTAPTNRASGLSEETGITQHRGQVLPKPAHHKAASCSAFRGNCDTCWKRML